MWTATKLISKNLIEICPKHLKTYICSVMQILTNSASCWGNEYIHMSTWIVGKDLKKNCCHRKNKFYSKLKTESITDTDYKHSKSVFEDSWLQNLGWHDDLYLQIYTCIYLHVVSLLLQNVFKSFTRIGVAEMFEEMNSQNKITNRCRYVTNGRKGHQEWNLSCLTQIGKSQ